MSRTQIIGKKATITDATNESLVGLHGEIVDESKTTIVMDCDECEKRILKNAVTLTIDQCVIQGSTLQGRPYERFKK